MKYNTVRVKTQKGTVVLVKVKVPCYFILNGISKPVEEVLFTSTGRNKIVRAIFRLEETEEFVRMIPTKRDNQIPLFFGEQEITQENGFTFNPKNYVIYVNPEKLDGRILYCG